MKHLFKLTLAFLIFANIQVFAQESIIGDINYGDLDKYIALAKQNNNRKKIFEERKEGIKTAIPMAQLSYLDIFNASYFYRPDQKNVVDLNNPYNVNGFQLGVTVNLGTVLQKPFMVKRAKSEYKVAQLEALDYTTTLELEVKNRYYDYIQQVSQLKLSTQDAQESKGVAESLRRKFERGEITLDIYNESRMSVTSSASAKIQSEVNYLKAKDLLENIIGMKLSEVK